MFELTVDGQLSFCFCTADPVNRFTSVFSRVAYLQIAYRQSCRLIFEGHFVFGTLVDLNISKYKKVNICFLIIVYSSVVAIFQMCGSKFVGVIL